MSVFYCDFGEPMDSSWEGSDRDEYTDMSYAPTTGAGEDYTTKTATTTASTWETTSTTTSTDPTSTATSTTTDPLDPPETDYTRLTAGMLDDNKDFDYFVDYFNDMAQELSDYPVSTIADRITVTITNGDGIPLHNAIVTVTDSQQNEKSYSSLSEGTVLIFPTVDGLTAFPLTCIASYQDSNAEVTITEQDTQVNLQILDTTRIRPATLDLQFTIDVTGSMSDELNYLQDNIDYIIQEINAAYSQVPIRLGLVVYRDIGDDFVTQSHDFTTSVSEFKSTLSSYYAGGGGDYPEAMSEALYDMNFDMSWSENTAAKIVFLIADAPPQLDRQASYETEGWRARENQIKIYTVAASGVAFSAELVMRYLSMITGARYIFLTDDSGYGGSHAEPTDAPCYDVEYLATLMIRLIKTELEGEIVPADPDTIVRTTCPEEE